jgi:hypothetical protein
VEEVRALNRLEEPLMKTLLHVSIYAYVIWRNPYIATGVIKMKTWD